VVRKAKQPNASVPEAIGLPGLELRPEAARTSTSPAVIELLCGGFYTQAPSAQAPESAGMHVYRDLHGHAVVNSYRQPWPSLGFPDHPITVLLVPPKLLFVMTFVVASDERFLLRSGTDCSVSAYEGAGRWPDLFSGSVLSRLVQRGVSRPTAALY
jgi:hypothetical protein